MREVIGEGVRRVREAGDARQDDVARAARRYGLAWSQSKVAALERGDKPISLEEFALLPIVLADATGSPVSIGALVPDDVLVRLTEVVTVPGELMKQVYADEPVQPETVSHERHARIMRVTFPDVPFLDIGDAEQKAAVRLRVTPGAVATAAGQLWGRSLAAERDRVVREREPDASPDRRRALRGQVTRQLLDVLAAELAGRES